MNQKRTYNHHWELFVLLTTNNWTKAPIVLATCHPLSTWSRTQSLATLITLLCWMTKLYVILLSLQPTHHLNHLYSKVGDKHKFGWKIFFCSSGLVSISHCPSQRPLTRLLDGDNSSWMFIKPVHNELAKLPSSTSYIECLVLLL